MKNTKLLALVVLLIVVVAMVLKFWSVFMLFACSAVVAYLLSPIVRFIMKKTKIKRGIAVLIVTLLFLAIITIAISVTIPTLVSQVSSLVSEIYRLAPTIETAMNNFLDWLESLSLPATVTNSIDKLFDGSDKFIANFLTSIVSGIMGMTSQLLDIVVFIILVVYFMLDGEKLLEKMFQALPKKLRGRAEEIAKKSDLITWKYLKSKIVISFFTSVVTYIGFLFIGVKYAFVFAFLSFVLNFIPYFGSLLSGALPIFMCLLTGSWGKAIAVLILTLVINQIEGNVISPKIQGDLSGVHPITVMFAILACNQIWGPAGMLFAVPLAALIKLCLTELYEYTVSDLR